MKSIIIDLILFYSYLQACGLYSKYIVLSQLFFSVIKLFICKTNEPISTVMLLMGQNFIVIIFFRNSVGVISCYNVRMVQLIKYYNFLRKYKLIST